jgi:lipoprotein-releasing system permease protein
VFHFQFLDSDVYYSSSIPSDLHRRDVLWISVVALVLTLLSTIYPAVRAARTPPADALRYD